MDPPNSGAPAGKQRSAAADGIILAVRLLWVTTKPPWPPVDGGRLVAALTVEALAGAGHAVEVLAPDLGRGPQAGAPAPAGCSLQLVPASPRPLWRAVMQAALSRQAVSIVRHTLPAVQHALDRRLSEGAPVDAVVAEQVQALAQCQPAFARGIPVALRAQNVESDLLAALGGARPAWRRVLRHEAARLAAYEGAAVRRAALTLALTAADAQRLRLLSGALRGGPTPSIVTVAAPFPAQLPGADQPLPGAPAVVLFGSPGWRPNAAAAEWFVEHVWPAVRTALPAARLHVFGPLPARLAQAAALTPHASPAESRAAFAPGSLLVVPLHVASGVRLRILEAWARGVPVVATPQAAAGLEAEDGRELLLARDDDGFTRALRLLHSDAHAAPALVAAGRARLHAAHAPGRIATRLADLLAGLRR